MGLVARFEADIGKAALLDVTQLLDDVDAVEGAAGRRQVDLAVQGLDHLTLRDALAGKRQGDGAAPLEPVEAQRILQQRQRGNALQRQVRPGNRRRTAAIERQPPSPTAAVELQLLQRDAGDLVVELEGKPTRAGLYVLVNDTPDRQLEVGIG